MDTMKIATTIHQQIKELTPQIVRWSWGASAWKAVPENSIEGINGNYLGGLLFYVRGMKHKGHVFITLMLDDTYTINIGHCRKNKFNVIKSMDNVYFTDLGFLIDNLIESGGR